MLGKSGNYLSVGPEADRRCPLLQFNIGAEQHHNGCSERIPLLTMPRMQQVATHADWGRTKALPRRGAIGIHPSKCCCAIMTWLRTSDSLDTLSVRRVASTTPQPVCSGGFCVFSPASGSALPVPQRSERQRKITAHNHHQRHCHERQHQLYGMLCDGHVGLHGNQVALETAATLPG